MYKTIDLKESPKHLENRIREYWKNHNLVQKSIDIREGSPLLSFTRDPLPQMVNLEFIM